MNFFIKYIFMFLVILTFIDSTFSIAIASPAKDAISGDSVPSDALNDEVQQNVDTTFNNIEKRSACFRAGNINACSNGCYRRGYIRYTYYFNRYINCCCSVRR